MFLSPLIAMKVGENRNEDPIWEIYEEFVWRADGTTKGVRVPKGFQTDFASVPRVPLAYLACGNTAHEAAVIHDYLYRHDSNPVVERVHADDIFNIIMKEMNVAFLRRIVMYRAVRLFAGGSWHVKSVKDKLV